MGQVLHADVRDPTLYFLSLEAPFTDVLWSAPCQPWSLAGNTMGLACPDGLLIPHVLGLLLLFAPQRSIGENVPGLIEHPDWPRVRELMKLLPYQVHVLCSKLETISPMARNRLFFLFCPSSVQLNWETLVLNPTDWLDTGAGHLPPFLEEQTLLSEKQKRMLSERTLLPVAQRVAAYNHGLVDGPEILARRKASGVLPTLVASYRRQCELPTKNLITKGSSDLVSTRSPGRPSISTLV